ncbi:MAG: hypothetical protein KPEEDBHJ_01690 [Anaerolineales bacterium]|nr:hypothetical protein [Anaerolineales bacterium]
MTHIQLDDAFVDDILRFLKLRRQPPTYEYLNALIGASIRRVPWESVTRILKRDAASKTADCPRFPREVWNDAMRFGGGGTCFEINYSDTKPFMLESFDHDGKHEIRLNPKTLTESLAEQFQIPAEKISAALSLVGATKEPV